MPNFFGLDRKQIFITEFNLLNQVQKVLDMKLDFQNINWEFKSLDHNDLGKIITSVLPILGTNHRLRTPNEGINQRYLKNWAYVADKICFGRTYKFGIGIELSAVQRRLFPLWASIVRGSTESSPN